MFDERISIFTGHFGSGKTEVAVNYAVKLGQINRKTAIVDLDIANPYFRTKDAADTLQGKGIWVMTPMYANTNVDVPALPPEINTLFEKKEYSVVLDVGGDDVGARVLSRYNEEILSDKYEMYFVINTRRPMTDTVDKIIEMVGEIEDSSRLKVTRLVNNTNILKFTTVKELLEGQKMITKVSERLGIPNGFTSGMADVIHEFKVKSNMPVLEMDKYIMLPWEHE